MVKGKFVHFVCSWRCIVVAAVVWLCLGSLPASGAPLPRTDRVLVLPRPGAEDQLEKLHKKKGRKVKKRFELTGGIQTLELTPNDTVESAIREYRESGFVQFAEPDYPLFASKVPNDPAFGQLWGLRNSGQSGGSPGADVRAPAAWETRTGAEEIIVAVVDSGIRYTHEDLAANMWRNPRETRNGRDDDGNGIIDDIHGYNAVDHSGDPYDDSGHGTHVAGIIGAVGGNAKGIVGVAWKVQLMACKFMSADGYGDTSDAIAAINYARANGAKVINASWGGPYGSYSLRFAINQARNAGIIFVTAAGNELANNDLYPSYPANYSLNNIISVAAVNRRDELDRTYSNYGAATVDLAAPGTDIYSTWHTGNSAYLSISGTSMAAPHVSGAVALLRAAYPNESYQSIVSRLLTATDKLPSLAGRCVTGGRLNLEKLFPKRWSLTVAQVNGGTVEIAPEAQSSYQDGSVVRLIAQPAEGYRFVGWTGDVVSTNNPLELVLEASKVVTPSFDTYLPVDPVAPKAGAAEFEISAAGLIRVRFSNPEDAAQLQTSTDLVHWSPVITNTVWASGDGIELPISYSDTARFFRIAR